MKGKYITTQIVLASMVRPATDKKNVHTELQETIAERKQITGRYNSNLHYPSESIENIHEQLKKTLAERRQVMEQLDYSLKSASDIYKLFLHTKAA